MMASPTSSETTTPKPDQKRKRKREEERSSKKPRNDQDPNYPLTISITPPLHLQEKSSEKPAFVEYPPPKTPIEWVHPLDREWIDFEIPEGDSLHKGKNHTFLDDMKKCRENQARQIEEEREALKNQKTELEHQIDGFIDSIHPFFFADLLYGDKIYNWGEFLKIKEDLRRAVVEERGKQEEQLIAELQVYLDDTG